MRIVFMGTPKPAALCLQALLDAQEQIVAVVTQPDRPSGRGQKISSPPVKDLAKKYHIPIEQPEKVKNNPDFIDKIRTYNPDLIVVVAYGKILPKELLEIPRHGAINIHASLLPKYRGAGPIQWAILKGEKETGVTVMQIVPELDAGDILLQKKIPIDINDTSQSLGEKLFDLGAELLVDAVGKIKKGTIARTAQKDHDATQAPLLMKEIGEIDFRKTAREVHDQIRALIPWPTAHTFYHGKMLKLLNSEIILEKKGETGGVLEIVKNKGFIIACQDAGLLITEVQLEGKRKMKASEFISGHKLKEKDILPS
ncbi:MAG: methionyl-tRNA formyltransferase [Candidatus Saganbacteria bacterium]|nr:methionyl-tRNA formyltransferase [Candidatus Saganbacteria bacterium]